MIVKARNGLSFKIQGKRVSDIKEVQVIENHDVKIKLREGSLIDVSTIRIQNAIKVPKPIELDKQTDNKKINKEN